MITQKKVKRQYDGKVDFKVFLLQKNLKMNTFSRKNYKWLDFFL